MTIATRLADRKTEKFEQTKMVSTYEQQTKVPVKVSLIYRTFLLPDLQLFALRIYDGHPVIIYLRYFIMGLTITKRNKNVAQDHVPCSSGSTPTVPFYVNLADSALMLRPRRKTTSPLYFLKRVISAN